MAKEKETSLQLQKTSAEIELMNRQAEAQFALTPMGQTLKQFEICQRMGQLLSQSSIVPDTYKGNMPNCAVAVDMALRMNMPPMAVMQNLYVVHGNPAWSSKFLIACINGCGRFTPLEYQAKDGVLPDSDEFGYRCLAYSKDDTKRENPLYGPWVTWKMVKAEGWLAKNGSKWKTMPDMMFRYRAAAFWQRLYAPELAMGINTAEEAYDVGTRVSQPIDTAYVDLSEQEPKAPEITDAMREEAFTDIANCKSVDDVKAVRAKHRVVYDNDDQFRETVILYHDRLGELSAEAEDKKPETSAETAGATA